MLKDLAEMIEASLPKPGPLLYAGLFGVWGIKMNKGAALAGVAVAVLLSAAPARAEDKEPLAVVALGGAGEWGFPGRTWSVGPSASVEFSVIKDWLEIEVGGAKLFRRGHSEWEGELVFR